MSDFFEPPPPAPEPPRYRQPPWVAPPRGTLPGVVAVELLLAQTDKVAVYISRLAAYPSGFEFDVMTVTAPGEDETDFDPMLFGPHSHRPGSAAASEMLRIGVQFSDGSKATNTSGFHHGGDPPTGPVMHGGGGGGGGGRWQQTMWVWPLPPPGPLAFVSEWPAAGAALSEPPGSSSTYAPSPHVIQEGPS
jgi:hypothetical protein